MSRTQGQLLGTGDRFLVPFQSGELEMAARRRIGSIMPDPIVVIVTEADFRKAEAVFTSNPGVVCQPAPAEEALLAAAVQETGARGVILGSRPYTGDLYRALAPGSVIARFGVGHDGIDKDLATQLGLLCTNTPGVLESSVAELTMLLVSAAARHLLPVAGAMAQRRWAPGIGTELRSRTLAIVGHGRIGREVARIAAEGFRMNVVAANRPEDFPATVGSADFVSLHIPSTPANRGFLDSRRLSLIPERAWLINTARGDVVDESALYEALSRNQIAGAALDVFAREPYRPPDPARDFRTLPNVILTPHIGSLTREASERIARRALGNVVSGTARDFAGMDLVNPEVLDSLSG